MAGTTRVVWLGTALSLAGMGCTHFIESRTVAKFADALEKKDLSIAKSRSTEEFNRKALRHAKALDDFEILHLPSGSISVVKVVNDSPTEKSVTVEVGKKKRQLLYKLVKDEKSGDWKVDDIFRRQKQRGAPNPPVTEQMDLLLTVREFLESWDGGGRERILSVVTPELAKELGGLSRPALAQLAAQVVGKQPAGKKLRPKAELDGADAIVTLPRSTGKMILVFRLQDDKWKVADVAVESRKDKNHLPSLLKKAVVIRTAHRFLKAYAAGDRRELEKNCTQKFYRESLASSDLALMPLHSRPESITDFEVTQDETRANYLIKERHRWVRIAMLRSDNKRADADSPTEYLVEDVAIHRLKTKQEIRLSSFFTARAIAQLFAEGVATRNLTLLRKISSGDFRRRVWDKADDEMMKSLPMLGLTDHRLTIEATDFDGAVTEVHVRQGGQDATYLLRDDQGRVRVDDVHVLKFGRPQSLKSTMEVAVPILRFARAIQKGDIASLQRNSSKDFNRLIWKQARVVPPSGLVVPGYLRQPITAVHPNGDEIIVTLGDDQLGAKVLLVSESSHFVVDDIMLIAGPLPRQRAKLKHRLRTEMANSITTLPGLSAAQKRNSTLIRPDYKNATADQHTSGRLAAGDSVLDIPYRASSQTDRQFRAGQDAFLPPSSAQPNSGRFDLRAGVSRPDTPLVNVDPGNAAFDDGSIRAQAESPAGRNQRIGSDDSLQPQRPLR